MSSLSLFGLGKSSSGSSSQNDSGSAVTFSGLAADPTIAYDSYVNVSTVTSYCRKGFDPLDVTLADIPSNTNDEIGAIRDTGSDAYHAVSPGALNTAAQNRGALASGSRSALKANGSTSWFNITDGNTLGFDSFVIAVVLKLNQPTVLLPFLGEENGESYFKIKQDSTDVLFGGNNLTQSFTGFNSSGFNICIFRNNVLGGASGFTSWINTGTSATSSATTNLTISSFFTQYLQYSFEDIYFDGQIPYFGLWTVSLSNANISTIYSTLASTYSL